MVVNKKPSIHNVFINNEAVQKLWCLCHVFVKKEQYTSYVCHQGSSFKVLVFMHHLFVNKEAVSKLWCLHNVFVNKRAVYKLWCLRDVFVNKRAVYKLWS